MVATHESLQRHHQSLTLPKGGCGFKHDFRRLGEQDARLCTRQPLDCGHSNDFALLASITLLHEQQIISKEDITKIKNVLANANIELSALDTWTQELESVYFSIIKSSPRTADTNTVQFLARHNILLDSVLDDPEILREVMLKPQEIAVKPKKAIHSALKLSIAKLLLDDPAEAKTIMSALVQKCTDWIPLDDSLKNEFIW